MNSAVDRLVLGDFVIERVLDGLFRIDGGAMFGVVPKVLWEKRAAPDSQNRIALTLSCFLISGKGSVILAETGVGPDVEPRFISFYAVERNPGLFERLGEAGLGPEDIDIVWNSHLHFDHCGGNTVRDGKGAWIPGFPRARYAIQKGEWEQALHPVDRDKPSYAPARLRPLAAAGRLTLLDGDTEVAEGVRALLVPGHTAFHQCLRVDSGGRTFLYFGDLVPTAAHIDLPYIMSYDLFPVETFSNKKRLYEAAADGDWIVGFSHDPRHAFGKIRRAGASYAFEPMGA
jgi:glyoxylase-like metal-dependent hydrolase (beta-lactamase superfamily II)